MAKTSRMIRLEKSINRIESINRVNGDMHRVYNLLKDVVEKMQIEPLAEGDFPYLAPMDMKRLKSAWYDANDVRLILLDHAKKEREYLESLCSE